MKAELERIIDELTSIALNDTLGAHDQQLILGAIDMIYEVSQDQASSPIKE